MDVDKLIIDIHNKWIDGQTRDVSYEDVVKAVHNVYALDNKTMPIVFQVDGPIHCTLTHIILCQPNNKFYNQLDSQLYNQLDNQLYNQLDSQLDSQLGSQLISQLTNQLDSQLYSQLNSQLYSQLNSQLHNQLHSQLYMRLHSQLYNQLYNQLDNQLYDQLYNQLDNQLDSQLDSQLRSQLHSQLDSQLKKLWCPLWRQSWAALYEAGLELGVKYDENKYNILRNWSLAVPICRATEKICIVSKWPITVKWEDNVLHNDSGPSVEFRDGFKLWTINGVVVDKQIVMEPETQTLKQIESEANEEVKRVRIDRYGWDRYLLTAEEIDSNYNERDQQEEKLYRLKSGNIIFRPIDPSTGRKYTLGCPSDIQTCRQAQHWHSFGLDQYAIHRS